MFNSTDYPASLEEALFDSWMEKGRDSKIPYAYLAVVWNEREERYFPVFLEKRVDLESFERYGNSYTQESLVAAYDLYSESRVI